MLYDCYREFLIEVSDRAFNPAILVIEEGDRIWWSWDKEKVQYHLRPFFFD